MPQYDIDALKAKSLCHACVGEPYLRAEIKAKGQILRCSYCSESVEAYHLKEVAERIESAIDQHYTRTSNQSEGEREGERVTDAISNAAEIPEDAAQDVQRILEDQYYNHESAKMGDEVEFSSDSYYEEKGTTGQAWQEAWDSFEKSLRTEARFFSQSAAKLLSSIFDGIDTMQTYDGRPLVLDAGPETAFTSVYRARVFQSEEKLKTALCRPDMHLGGPPPLLASAGRMNARGISVFYGANDPKIAIAEVRAPVGSDVVVARFEIIKPLRLLDLTALGAVSSKGSVFDPQFAGCLERETFLRSLSQHMTRPIMPDDEAFDYLTTQAVADFLATESVAKLDGILFPSVQAAGKALNIVIFHKAARVVAIDCPSGVEISATTGYTAEEGWEADYSVIEEVSPPVKDTKKTDWPADSAFLFQKLSEPCDSDWREPALRIVLDSVKVHKVRGVEFDTKEFIVTRHRWEKREPPF